MLNVIRKIFIWILGLPILLVLICFVTVAAVLTGIGTLFFKGISILAILATGFFILVKAMPVNTQLIPMVLLSIAMFWIPELMAIPLAGAIFAQGVIWNLMTE